MRVSQESVGRREANKARTRAALIAAVYDLIDTEGFDVLSAERVAAAAGLSRRTFFNYIESVEAAVAIGADDVLECIGGALAARPVGEAVVDSALHIIEDLFTVEFLADATRAWRAVDGMPAARRYALEAQSDQVLELANEWGMARLDPEDRDPLRVRVLTACVMSAFEQGRRQWLVDLDGEVDDAALADFRTTIRRAIAPIRPALDAAFPLHSRD